MQCTRCVQDKYILGLMVMLCGVCVWHAVVGAAATEHLFADDHVPSPEMTSSPPPLPEISSSFPANASPAAWTLVPCDTAEMAKIVMADKMALVMFGSLYLLFHVVFVARICTSVSFQYWPITTGGGPCKSITIKVRHRS